MSFGSTEKQCKCAYCSNSYRVPASAIPGKWAYPDHHPYCSNKCKSQANAGASQSSKSSSSSNSANYGSSLDRFEKDLEAMESAQLKKEKAEKKAKLAAKAAVLRRENKPFMAFVTEKQENLLGAVITSVVMGIPCAFMLGGDVVGIITIILIIIVLIWGLYKYFKEKFRK